MPCSRGYFWGKSLDFQKQKTEEKQMKNIAKYGIVLFSVAVLGAATTVPMTVSADDASQPVESVTQPQAQTQEVVISHWDISRRKPKLIEQQNVQLAEGDTYTVAPKEYDGLKFREAITPNDEGVGVEVKLPHQLKYGGLKQIDLLYEKADPQKPAEPEKPADPQKPAEPQKPAPIPTPTPDPKPTPEPTPQPTPNPSDNGNNSNQGNKLNPSDNKPSDNGNGKSENPTDNQNPAKNGNDSTPSDNGEKQNNSNQEDNNRDTTKQSGTNKSNETTKNKLPNTGEAVSSLGFLGVGLLSSLGLTKKRYKGRHERH